MSDTQIVFTLLPKREGESSDAPRHYACSVCEDDIFNINLHAQYSHNALVFDVISDETPRKREGMPFHPCGVKGCEYDANHQNQHSWEQA